ncbi:MAG TPA: dTDP-4-dehydrorhamnose reductase [Anaerolineales bacterium]|nr:dTDP-4-dehydrorhamnose reductase [Anaerolineales bacterium]
MTLRTFITGINGQLGRTLASRFLPEQVAGGDLPEFDVCNPEQVYSALTAFAPQLVIHSAAWTNVDACAREPEKALWINGMGAQSVALACAKLDIPMVYISTNEVFDGAQPGPYREYDATHPINGYGYSKLAGEQYTQHLLKKFYIVRTSWLYADGGRNFIHRIQQLADERGELAVVTDEVGAPTWVEDLADAILQLAVTERYGIYHLVNDGHCSRYDFARFVLEHSGRAHIQLNETLLANFKRDSTVPPNGALANQCASALGIRLRPWQAALLAFMRADTH